MAQRTPLGVDHETAQHTRYPTSTRVAHRAVRSVSAALRRNLIRGFRLGSVSSLCAPTASYLGRRDGARRRAVAHLHSPLAANGRSARRRSFSVALQVLSAQLRAYSPNAAQPASWTSRIGSSSSCASTEYSLTVGPLRSQPVNLMTFVRESSALGASLRSRRLANRRSCVDTMS